MVAMLTTLIINVFFSGPKSSALLPQAEKRKKNQKKHTPRKDEHWTCQYGHQVTVNAEIHLQFLLHT